ncbi:MAG: RNA-directed DNA polymerase, partial [Anaerolineales bacterium]
MSSTPLWDEFATIENFTLAWQRTVNCTSRIMQDELGIRIFAHNLQANLEDLLRKVQANDYPYAPLTDHKVYVPKPSTTLRTMSLIAIPDLIIYQALVNVIANSSHPHLVNHENQHVLGNLYAGAESRWMLKRWKTLYARFIERIGKIYAEGNRWIASTDIVAFYDTIDHERLVGLVNKHCQADETFNDFFRRCLAKWSPHNSDIKMSRGIPQGSNASDYLANLFLYDIDRVMIVSGYHYVRYVDDIRILGAEKSIVQKGLILFDLELKKAGLVAQVSKTSVHEIRDIEKEISRLKFTVTDPTGEGEYILVTTPSTPQSEQAESISKHVQNTPSEEVDSAESAFDEDEDSHDSIADEKKVDIDKQNTKNLQEQLRENLLENIPLLDDPD